jgi:hypothetical protein
MPADSLSAAVNVKDFGTSRWQLSTECYNTEILFPPFTPHQRLGEAMK